MKTYNIDQRYMDGNVVVGTLEVCLKGSAWSEFKAQPFYKEMIQYLGGENVVPEVKEEKEMKRIKMPQQGIRGKLNTTLLDTKKIVEFGVVEELAKRIVLYAEKHKMTISNIRESVEKVEIYMEDNAVLQDDRDPDELNPNRKNDQ